jgi:PAS domain S-box-containing protein
MRMAVVAPVALIVGALLAWWMVDQAMAQPDGREAGERPALFLANESLPPMNFMKHGEPTGIVIGLAEALAKRMHRPVEIRLMHWAEAQQLVLDGRADALLQINPNPERLRIYDFSEPLLTSEFTIFTSVDRLGIASMRDLRGLKVGVEKQGLPISLLQEDPQIIVEIIPDLIQGFKLLATGTVDAVVADRWVGSYVLAENSIRGVKLIEDPISRSDSAIAVKKGNENLLRDINSALAEMRRDGTYDRVIKSWQSKEVIFKTREQLRQQVLLIGIITGALVVALVAVAVLVREIRRRRRVEETLRESEAKYRNLFENMAEEVHFWQLVRDEAGRIKTWRLVDANPPTLKTWGRASVDEIKGKTTDEIFGPGATEHYMPIVQKIMTEGVAHSFEDYFAHLDRHFRFTSVPFGEYFITTGADITGIKKTELALRESEERYRLIFQTANEGIWVTDGERRTILVNQKMADMLGYTTDELQGRIPSEFLHAGQEPVVLKARQDLTGGATTHYEFRFRRKDGSDLWVISSAAPVRDSEGRLIKTVSMLTDITERKQAEEALRKAHDELEIRVRERTSELSGAVEKLRIENIQRKELEDNLREKENQVRFFASQCLTAQETERKRVAGELHDSIAASLGAIRLRIDRAVEGMKQGTCGPEPLQEIASAVTVINNEVRRIMADLRPSILDDLGILAALTWFCREYQTSYSHIAVEKKFGIEEREVPDSLKTPIFRICQEAMNNIAKHSQASLVNLSLKKGDARIGLSLQDNGQGFDLEAVKKGMGLSTMRERAQLSGGAFDLESTIGKGTVIWVSWPV